MTNDELAYVAGFFDGEGSVGVYGQQGRSGFCLKTQLTQNYGIGSMEIMESLVAQFGGMISKQRTLSGGEKVNWQLTSLSAASFLGAILPYLRLKKEQAEIAIAWQKQRHPLLRDVRGRRLPKPQSEFDFDKDVGRLVRLLKTQDIDTVLANHADLVKVRHQLKQVLCVKG